MKYGDIEMDAIEVWECYKILEEKCLLDSYDFTVYFVDSEGSKHWDIVIHA